MHFVKRMICPALLYSVIAIGGMQTPSKAQIPPTAPVSPETSAGGPATPVGGPIPPRDPRLPAPPVVETAIPPVVAPPPLQTQLEAPNRPLTADEAARIALRLQPNIAIAQAALRIQRGRTTQVRAALHPIVTISTGYNYLVSLSSAGSSGTPGGGSSSSTAGGAGSAGGGSTASSPSSTTRTTTVGGATAGFLATGTLRQLIFDFNHIRNLVRQNATFETAASANISRVQHDTVFQVKQTFYQYVLDYRLVQVDEQEVANRQSQLDLATARYNTGVGLLSDLVTAQTAKAEAITNLALARQTSELTRINLALLMGIDARTPFVPADTGEPAPASTEVNALTERALRQRPEILQAQATLHAYQYGVRAARTSNAPVITGNLEIAAAGDQFLPQNSGAVLGIGLLWTPIDGGLSRGLQEEQRANVQGAQAQLNANRLTVISDVSGAYVGLTTAGQRVVLAQADVANAAQSVRIATGRYATGIGQFIDIINAQAFLLTARINLVAAEENVQQSRANLQHATGDVIPVP